MSRLGADAGAILALPVRKAPKIGLSTESGSPVRRSRAASTTRRQRALVPAMRPFEVWIDRGGTFTDCLGRGADGALRVAKVPSEDLAPIRGIEALLGLPREAPLPACDVRIGTTVATNALLERKG